MGESPIAQYSYKLYPEVGEERPRQAWDLDVTATSSVVFGTAIKGTDSAGYAWER